MESRSSRRLYRAALSLAFLVAMALFAFALCAAGTAQAFAADASSAKGLQVGSTAGAEKGNAAAEDGEAADKAAKEADEKAKAAAAEAAARKAAEAEAARIAKMAVAKDGLYNVASAWKGGFALAVKDASTKAKAKVVPASSQDADWAQKWIFVQDKKTGYYRIRNLNSRMLLTVSGKVKSGSGVVQAKQSTSKKQLWELAKKGGAFVMKPAANSRLAITMVKGKKGTFGLKLAKLTGKKAQRFALTKTEAIRDGGSYFIRSASQSKKALAVKGASTKNKAKIVLTARSSKKFQKFRMEKSGSAYRMQCVQSCKYVSAGKSTLTQVTSGKGKARKWKLALDLATGTFTIASASSGKFADVASGKLKLAKKSLSKAGAPVKSQRFVLVPTYGFTVFLDAGHGKNSSGWGVYDPGAEGCGYEEADLTKDLAKRIESQLEGSDVRVFNGSDNSVPYWQRNSHARELGSDVVLSAHFDADGGSSTSTMVGTGGAAGSSAFNSIIHRKLVSSIGLSDGGTMHRSDITVVNGSLPSVLMEVCFIDNYYSLHTYLNRRDRVAASLAEGILEAEKLPALQKRG